jgi:translation initiation factor 2B subunit (eIF-2B alpha/beta/delta family)
MASSLQPKADLRRAAVSSMVPTPSTGGPKASSAGWICGPVEDAIEQLLIKLNRSKFTVSEERSMTTIAAKGALRIFKILLEKDKPRPVSRVIAVVSRICQHHFSRAPSFRFVLANVTRMALLAIREAGAAVSAAAIARGEGDTDLSALAEDNSALVFEDDDIPSSPRGGMPARSVSFSAYGSTQGHFPRVGTNDSTNGEDGASAPNTDSVNGGAAATAAADDDDADGMGEERPSNVSFDGHMTPLTEATIPRIPSHFEGERYYRRLNYNDFRDRALRALEDINEHLSSMMETLCADAHAHIADGDTVLTFGASHTIMKFLSTAASRGRRFRVIALSADPHGNAYTLANVLTPYGIPVDVVPDSECFNVVPRVSKVFLSTEGVLANGGLLAPTGSLMVCIVAKIFSVDVVVIATTVKVSPYYPSDTACSSLVKLSSTEAKEMLWSTFSAPSRVLPPEHVHSVIAANGMESPLVFNPSVEYVSPEHVSIFVTDNGEFTTAYIHRFLKEQYHSEDTHL